MAIDSLFVLNSANKTVLEKHWRDDQTTKKATSIVLPAFLRYLDSLPHKKEAVPVWLGPAGTACIHVQRNDLMYLCTVSSEVGPLQVLDFLDRLVENVTEYIGNATEITIKENFTTVYEILSEMMDNGNPITTDIALLKSLVPMPNLVNRVIENVTGMGIGAESSPQVNTSSIPWRAGGIKYSRNEIYVDLIETIDAILESDGNIVSCDVSGSIHCDCRLSGMPDLRMTFVHPDALDNVSLHPCVRIPRWESEKALSFVPPDGKFKLLSYRVGPYAIQYGLPIHLSGKSTLEDNIYNIEITVGAAQLLYSKSAIGGMGHTGMPVLPTSSARERKLEDVRVVLPLPTTAYNIRMQTKKGTYSVDQSMSDQTKLTWELKTIGPNDSNIKLHAQFSVKRQHQDSTLALAAFAQFKLVGVSVSSVKINSLRMLRETYNIFKGVKTITKAGSFQVRL